ncbi:hypothetical protein ACWGK1_19585 [Streptomyces wedmorensis]
MELVVVRGGQRQVRAHVLVGRELSLERLDVLILPPPGGQL